MHILATTTATLDEAVEPIDLEQTPGDMVVLSFSDSDLSGLAAAWADEAAVLPSLRLASLRDLRHPMSIDLWIDRVGARAKIVVVRLLGGRDWWSYGVDRLTSVAHQRGIVLVLLPGEDRDDVRLAEGSTITTAEHATLLACFRAGGRVNLLAALRLMAGLAGVSIAAPAPVPMPQACGYLPGEGAVDLDHLSAQLASGRPVVAVLFYRSMLLARDTAPIDAFCVALAEQGLAAAPLAVSSLKDPMADAFLAEAFARIGPAAIVTTTGFAVGTEAVSAITAAGLPLFQAIIATTRRDAWVQGARGLVAADLAMHVVLPELDGRVLAGALGFKVPQPADDRFAFAAQVNAAEPDRAAMVAKRTAAQIRLARQPAGERRIAILMPDYPGMPGRTGYAVGLDVPESVMALLADLAGEGYDVGVSPRSARDLLEQVTRAGEAMPLAGYEALFSSLPDEARTGVEAAWGAPAEDADMSGGAFGFSARRFGNVIVALAPDRGRPQDRRASYHDAALPPRHALIAFGMWLQHVVAVDAVVHMGAHGTLEWLPGKAVALTAACFPEIVLGALPVIYPFIVSNPGEAAQAKRRIAAVTIGHLPPPLAEAGLDGEAQRLERLVDEYAQADGLDRKRRDRLARLIVQTAGKSGLAREAGVGPDADPDEALRRIDAWLCDLKDLAVKDGLHVFGRAEPGAEPARLESAVAERAALLAAIAGRHPAPGPAGAPSRGRRDVLPTGRNLFTADPRTLPTPTAMDLGVAATDEVLRNYLQEHGEMPRALVLDLWGSATLRTGGEEIAQGLALLGCRPVWDSATGRVTGIEVLPIAAVGRARVDVTWRISGLFRDLFPTQIALLQAAVRAVAARGESAEENPLAGKGGELARIFGGAPGAYGAGVESLLGPDAQAAEIGAAYLAAASHAYDGADGAATAMPGAFADRVAEADLLIHPGDDPGRDMLEGSGDAAFVGGFAAAAKLLGNNPDLVMLDLTDSARPRARGLSRAIARVVKARAINPRFIAGQMRHGPRGAAELAETLDRLADFAQTTDMVPDALIDQVHEAYLVDPSVRAFLLRENPAAVAAMAARLQALRRQGLWHPRRNDVDAGLAALRESALV